MESCEDGEGKLSREEIRETVRSLKDGKRPGAMEPGMEIWRRGDDRLGMALLQ